MTSFPKRGTTKGPREVRPTGDEITSIPQASSSSSSGAHSLAKSTRAEKRRDLALQKIHEKSAKRLKVQAQVHMNPDPPEASNLPPSGVPVLSLDEPNLNRPQPNLWGLGPEEPDIMEVSSQPETSQAFRDSSTIPADISTLPPEFQSIFSVLSKAIDAKLSAINVPSPSHPPPRSSRPVSSLSSFRAPINEDSDSSQEENEDVDAEEEDDPFQRLSEDEESQIKIPAPAAIFPFQLFKSLLLKARVSTGLAGQEKQTTPSTDPPEENLPYFMEEQEDKEVIPMPKLFKDALLKQWDHPASGLNPTSKDKKLYKLSPSYEELLACPKPDEPVKTLHSAAAMPGEAEEVLRPEDKRLEQMLKRCFFADTWAIKSAAAASFFSRAMLLWLRQLQQHIPPDDLRGQQDFNKIFAAAQYVADATLQSSRFAARSVAASTTARRLLWLRPWQAGVRQKWQLAMGPLKRDLLFGDLLDPLLTETTDKKKVLGPTTKKATKPQPFRRPSRQQDQGFAFQRNPGQYSPRFRSQSRNTRGRGSRYQRGSSSTRASKKPRW